ncbi:hypothetical protein [Jiangella sp. DSM 45060]|uniref:hypothetical protein n=1 Tax=Jiangella sp. DSM 45060 TaxID=1798224 RepID=UPI00087C47F7|nr:hypothetical protein [Jiangella sp. DSM 45060]SDT72084.1 hypothetical protein SAMN04515669_6575 [Jiangella sp. DSM 45060]
MSTISPDPPVRSLAPWWRSLHEPVAGVSVWTRRAALAIPLVVLPSSIWRIVTVVFLPLPDGMTTAEARGDLPTWLPLEVYVLLLSVVSEGLALLCVGLIARWGEVWPRWVPVLRGRRIPVPVALVPALLGATILTALWGWVGVSFLLGRNVQGERLADGSPLQLDSIDGVVVFVCYAPLMLWGPLLFAVALAYWRRRSDT